MELIQQELIASLIFIAGIVLVLYGFIRLFVREYLEAQPGLPSNAVRHTNEIESEQDRLPVLPQQASFLRPLAAIGLLALIVLGGAYLRLDGLENQSLSHPESYVPGIEFPEGISEPPPRISLRRTISWHFHDEPHPQGYYFFMWAWTKLFGTDLYVLRLPSVLFGVGSIKLIFWIGSMSYNRIVGLLSAGFLAFNGHHIFWSQRARMYALACFLGLLSMLLLLQLLREANKRPLKEALYVLVSWLGLFTQIFFWPFLATQMLWTTVQWKSHRSSRILTLQALIVILGAPLWAHAIYRSRSSPLGPPTLSFVQEYFSFGFLFIPDYWSIPAREIPTVGALLLALLGVVCISSALASREFGLTLPSVIRRLAARHLLLVAVGSILIILAMAALATRRQRMMALTGLIPVLALFIPAAVNYGWRSIKFGPNQLVERWPLSPGLLSPFFFLAVVPFLVLFGMSFFIPLLGTRLFVLFIPYLLIVIAVGVKSLSQRLFLGIPLLILLAALHGSSVIYFQGYPASARDYQDLAQKMVARIEEDDIIFAHHRSWVTTPIFYYLDKDLYRFVTEDFQSTLSHHPDRIWIIDFEGQPLTIEMRLALVDYYLQDQVVSHRGNGLLYVRREQATPSSITQSKSR